MLGDWQEDWVVTFKITVQPAWSKPQKMTDLTLFILPK